MAIAAALLAAGMMIALAGFFTLFLNPHKPLSREVIRALALMGPYPERSELFHLPTRSPEVPAIQARAEEAEPLKLAA